MKIHLNPEVKISLKEFRQAFGDQFKHLPKSDRGEAIRKEYQKSMDRLPGKSV